MDGDAINYIKSYRRLDAVNYIKRVFVKHAMTHDDPRWSPNPELISPIDRARWGDSTKIHDDPKQVRNKKDFLDTLIF